MFAPKSKKIESIAVTKTIENGVESAPAAEFEKATVAVRNETQNVIAKGTVIQGNIVAEGDLLIEGTVRGDVTTKTTLIVGPTCIIEGNILAEHAEVAGQVKGTVQALGLLIIKSSSMIDGDVLTKNLNVESGSTFNGRFTVGSVTSTAARKVETIKAEPAMKIEANVLGLDARRPAIAVNGTSKV
jgi:cytoskeletal protein CcmA (bactofilin family)